MRQTLCAALSAFALSPAAFSQGNPCDLTGDGAVTNADVVAAIQMTLGTAPCRANVLGSSVCNVAVIQRVANAVTGQCQAVSGVPASVLVTWNASTSAGVAGYNVFRSTSISGGFTKLNATLVAGLSFSDTGIAPGSTYYYYVTAVDSTGAESDPSNIASVPIPR